jgi:hypothetical protein
MPSGYHLHTLEVRDFGGIVIAVYAGEHFIDLVPGATLLTEAQYPILTQAEFEDPAVDVRIRAFMDGLCPDVAISWSRIFTGSPPQYFAHARTTGPHFSTASFKFFQTNIKRKQSYEFKKTDISSPLCTYKETGYTKIKSFRKYVLP